MLIDFQKIVKNTCFQIELLTEIQKNYFYMKSLSVTLTSSSHLGCQTLFMCVSLSAIMPNINGSHHRGLDNTATFFTLQAKVWTFI